MGKPWRPRGKIVRRNRDLGAMDGPKSELEIEADRLLGLPVKKGPKRPPNGGIARNA